MKKEYNSVEDIFLTQNYPIRGKVYCAEKLNRTLGSIRSRVAFLGLKLQKNTDFYREFQEKARISKIGKKRPEHSALMKKYASEGRFPSFTSSTQQQRENISLKAKERIQKNGHPRGMLGKHHSKETKEKFSINAKKMWADPNSKSNSFENKQRLSDRATQAHAIGLLNQGYSRAKQGHYDINGKDIFFRSLWEANYALYLDFLKSKNQIKSWSFEQDTFWFEKIRRGVRSYKPDFKIFNIDGTIEYHEVKGWMDKKSATKLKRMKKYHPQIKIILIEKDSYNSIKKGLGKMLGFF